MRKLIFTLLVILSFCNFSNAQNVIEPELQNVMNQKGDEMISVNIIFKSQIDINTLRNTAKNITDKKVRRDIMVDELKLFAEKEQHEVLSILTAEEKSMKVTDIKSHWMTNYINCKADRDVIYHLSQHPDILMIGYDEIKDVLFNEKSEKAEATKSAMTENITKVNADDVWNLGYTGYGVIVAVIDSGVNYNHVDLADHLWDGGYEFPMHGYDVYYNDNDPMDLFGHGTHCAGTICGDGTSGTKTGIAPNATLMCVKAINDEGGGSAEKIQAGMEWAIEHHADILSLSLGIPNSTITERTLLRHTCVNALEFGIVAAIAAGNEGDMQWMNPIPNNVRVPGSCPPPWLHPDQADVNPGELSCVVSVGAVNFYDAAASFSSHGPVTWQETEFADYAYQPGIGLIRPDVCAPGVDIISSDFANNNGLVSMSGTSMATPCVAGVMALMLEKNPNLSPADICMLLETTGVKLTPNKSNVTGSARIDALAAIENIECGNMKYISHIIDDKENGNDNGNLNAYEQVNLQVTFKNDSEESYDNIKAVLRTNNVLVRIDDSIAQINSIGANETITINEGFAFLIDETADFRTLIGFDVYFYDENDEVISYIRIPINVKDSEIQYSSIVIMNDDNNNGILEAGETADLGVVLNNIGNEMAISLTGTLSSSSSKITINTNEASFNSIGSESSAVAFFNVTMSDNLSDSYSIPFELVATNEFNAEHEFSFDYSNSCNIIFELKDDYGDGWSGAALIVKYSDGTPDEAFTITNGEYKTYTREIKTGVEVSLEWNKGSWDLECSFVVKNDKGKIIYSQAGTFSNGFLYSWINNCSAQNESYQMCEPVQNLQRILPPSEPYPASFSWETPANGNVLHYEIYRNSRLLGTTEELAYTDETATGTFVYIYSVRPVYNDCYGYFQNVEISSEDNVNENSTINASVYPNPSDNDFNIVCDNMTRVTVFNMMGSVIIDAQINDNSYTVSDLQSGVYFINIETNNGSIVRKVVKL